MRIPIRLVLAIVVFAICYLWIYRVPTLLIPAGPDVQRLTQLGSLGVGLAIAWFVWSRSKTAPTTVISWALQGAAAGCAIGFALGVLSGPFLFASKPNQGVLLGFFFTGPAGAVLGGLIGWSKRVKTESAA